MDEQNIVREVQQLILTRLAELKKERGKEFDLSKSVFIIRNEINVIVQNIIRGGYQLDE